MNNTPPVTGCTQYNGIKCSQHHSFAPTFIEFLKDQQFTHILEIGTYHGGFTAFIHDNIEKNTKFWSFDVVNQVEHDTLRQLGIMIFIRNIFNYNMSDIVDSPTINFLREPGKKLIMCDGGNKIFEFNCLAKYLNVGDFIMAHDYSDSVEYFESDLRGKVWNWCEIVEKDISVASDKCGLEFYNQEEFQKIVWVCKTKSK